MEASRGGTQGVVPFVVAGHDAAGGGGEVTTRRTRYAVIGKEIYLFMYVYTYIDIDISIYTDI